MTSVVFDRIADVLVEMFQIDRAKIKPETRLFDDLDLDSIDAIDMIAKLQEVTGRRIDENELKKIRTVGDVVALVRKHVEQSG